MQPRDTTSLLDIVSTARLILQFVAGIVREDFYQDVGRQFQVIRGLEIIGEAARRLSPEARQASAHIAWVKWISMRNRLSHAYDAIDLSLVWGTIHEDLPPLIQAIALLLHEQPDEST